MATPRAGKPEMTPVRSMLQGKSIKGMALLAFNASVVVFSIVCLMVGVIYFLLAEVDLSKNKFTFHSYNYMHLFYSLWGSAAQTIYFYMLVAIDILDLNSRNSTRLYKIVNNLKTFASYFFFSAVFPMSLAISAIFWGLYFIDRELIYPTILDEVYPYWVNHAMHSIPVVLVLIHALIEKEPPMKHTFLGILVVHAVYAVCVFYVKYTDNNWIYYGLHQFDDYRVYQLFSIGIATLIFSALLGHTISRAVQRTRKALMK